MDDATWWSPGDGAITVVIRVTPGARRSEVIDASGDRLRIRIAAPAHEGRANAEAQRFVAALFGVRRAAVSLVRGERSRDKTLRIAGVEAPPTDIGG
ncbi:MAG: DUF167 domain-containing protein [Acidimicrobiales bacterium]